MKKQQTALIGMLALGLLGACTSDVLLDHSATTEAAKQDVCFSIAIPDMMTDTRTDGSTTDHASTRRSDRGGLTNVDMNHYDLRYQIAVCTLGDDTTEPSLVWREPTTTLDEYAPVSFSVRLTPNRTYRVIAWADFVKQNTTADLHYLTDDLAHIDLVEASALTLNDESRDAFFISDTIHVGATSYSKSLTLRRPFAKLRIVTTDWHLYGQDLEMPDYVEIGYKNCNRYSGLDLLTSKATGKVALSDDDASRVIAFSELAEAKDYALGYDSSDNNRTLMVDYLMTDDLGDQEPIHFTFETKLGDKTITAWDIDTDIPVRRNWLTTLIGNMLTFGGKFTVDIDDVFENEYVVGSDGDEVVAVSVPERFAPYLF